MDKITTIGSYAGAVITLITLVTLIVKPIRQKFISWITENSHTDELMQKIDALTEKVDKSIEQNNIMKEELDKQSNAQISTMRNTILHIFFQYKDSDSIPAVQYQSAEDMYAAYHELGGNGTATHIMEEIRKKTIV